MSHVFKLRFDQMRENNLAKPDTEESVPSGTDEIFHSQGYARNLCLIWPDGRRAFYNYAYLVTAKFDPGSEMNQIRLGFSSEIVTLKGYSLDILFMQLLDHLPRIITAIDPRYLPDDGSSESIVVNIDIEVAN